MEERRSQTRRSTDRYHEKGFVRRVLTSFRFWVVLWGCALVGVVCFVLIIYARQSSDRAARHATAKAQYAQCIMSIPFLKKFNRFVHGVATVHRILVKNARRTHAATPPGSPAYRAQTENIRRLRGAREDVTGFVAPVPTKESCAEQHLR